MRALLAIGIGGGMIAAMIGGFADMHSAPASLRVFVIVIGAALILAGVSHARLRFNRYRAYNGGREREGTVRLFTPLDDDDTSAHLLFACASGEWLISMDRRPIRSAETDLASGTPARAYLGEDERIYGLDIGALRTLPISPGYPYEGKLRAAAEWAKARKAEMEVR